VNVTVGPTNTALHCIGSEFCNGMAAQLLDWRTAGCRRRSCCCRWRRRPIALRERVPLPDSALYRRCQYT